MPFAGGEISMQNRLLTRNLRKQKGLTLIEVLLSFAILAILTLAILPQFASALRGIVKAGNRSNTIYQSQNEAEDKIFQGAASTANSMTIVFPGGVPVTVTVQGENVTKGDVKIFIPD